MTCQMPKTTLDPSPTFKALFPFLSNTICSCFPTPATGTPYRRCGCLLIFAVIVAARTPTTSTPYHRRGCRLIFTVLAWQPETPIMSNFEELKHLRIPLEEIKLATDNFSDENFLGGGAFGRVYKGELSCSEKRYKVAVKQLDPTQGQGECEFLTEITLLSSCKHKNLVSLVGYCDESSEKLLIYEYESRGSLDKYLSDENLTWKQRILICIDAAHGVDYLHSGVGAQHRILHRDIKSSNVLLNDNWEAKISDFGLSRIGPSNQEFTFLVTDACGTFGYVDPQYMKTGVLTKESDVFSFGVLLFEVLCGRPACMVDYEDERRFLARLARVYYEQGQLDEIINLKLREQMELESLNIFSAIAFACLKEERRERPSMAQIVKQLEKALKHQLAGTGKVGKGIRRVGRWGDLHGGEEWYFLVLRDHKLKKITVSYSDWIYFLIFTSEDPNGELHTSERIGGRLAQIGRETYEIEFEDEETIIGIKGTVLEKAPHWTGANTLIESLTLITNKKTYGPFGPPRGTAFSVLPDKCAVVGFWGGAGMYLDSIGFYLRPDD